VTIDVILPVLNERAALPGVLRRMPPSFRPIVVDNGSTDGSGDLASELGATVVNEPQAGFGSACWRGLITATSDIVCFMDCDGSLDPGDLPKVTDPVREGRVDLMIGARRPASRRAMQPHARFANRYLGHRLRRLGVNVTDIGPMRSAKREALLSLGMEDRRSGWPLEMVLRARRAGWRIEEVSVPYAPRQGKSKVTGTVRGTQRAISDMRGWLAKLS